jgi:phosphomannomutase
MIDDVAAKAGGTVIRTPVGEANVANAMIKNNCVIGGEGNGGVIDLRVGPIRNSLVAMAMVLELMAETGKTISQLVDELPHYCMIKEKFEADAKLASKMLAEVKKEFKDAKFNDADGYRFDFADGWLHLRTSNTEPIMRAIAEAKDESKAREYIAAVEKIRHGITG